MYGISRLMTSYIKIALVSYTPKHIHILTGLRYEWRDVVRYHRCGSFSDLYSDNRVVSPRIAHANKIIAIVALDVRKEKGGAAILHRLIFLLSQLVAEAIP